MASIPFGPLIAASFKFVERSFYKYASHLFGFNANKCTSCKTCEKICPAMAIKFDEKPIINRNKCFLCFSCTRHCPSGAFYLRLMPNAKYFKGPKTIRGYIPPDEVLKNYERKVLS